MLLGRGAKKGVASLASYDKVSAFPTFCSLTGMKSVREKTGGFWKWLSTFALYATQTIMRCEKYSGLPASSPPPMLQEAGLVPGTHQPCQQHPNAHHSLEWLATDDWVTPNHGTGSPQLLLTGLVISSHESVQ